MEENHRQNKTYRYFKAKLAENSKRPFLVNSDTQFFKANVSPPYLPPKAAGDPEYTLVLDLDETLIHSDRRDPEYRTYKVRPYCNEFLTDLSKYFEIVIFTAAMQAYADRIVDEIDPSGNIKYRLYRQHCGAQKVGYNFRVVKDMRHLGRDITKTIIVDNLEENFTSTCPYNGIAIKDWYGDKPKDQELLQLMPILRKIAVNQEKDVRKVIKLYTYNL